MLKRLLLATLFLLTFSPIASATHILGGEITWRCDTTGKYIFQVVLYRDCSVYNIFQSIQVETPAGSIQAPKDTVISIASTCAGSINSCKEGYDAHVYVTDPVALTGTPPPQGWRIHYSTCCRQSSPSGADAAMYLEARIYPFTPKGATSPRSLDSCYDHSPQFATLPTSIQLTNSVKSHYFTAYDRDHDSLFYRLDAPLVDEFIPVSWNSGYSSDQPFPNSAIHPANQDMVLDSSIGMFTVGLGPNAAPGRYPTSMVVESWRYGDSSLGPQLIAEVKREMPIRVVQGNSSMYCTPTSQNAAPAVSVDTSGNPQLSGGDNLYTINVYAGDTATLRMRAVDNDLKTDCGFQKIHFSSLGAQARNILNDSILPCGGIEPCAEYSYGNSQNSFNQVITNTINFSWATDTQHIYNRYGVSTYFFVAGFEDNFCPASAASYLGIVVNMIDTSSAPSGVSLAEHRLSMDLKIFPNPVSDQFTIELSPEQVGAKAIVEIRDASGRLVKHQEVSAGVRSVEVDAPRKAGAYLVIFKREEERFFSQIVR